MVASRDGECADVRESGRAGDQVAGRELGQGNDGRLVADAAHRAGDLAFDQRGVDVAAGSATGTAASSLRV